MKKRTCNKKGQRKPLANCNQHVNPTGCARSEAELLKNFKSLTLNRGSIESKDTLANSSKSIKKQSNANPYCRRFVSTKSTQYRKLKLEWKKNVYIARSNIQGLGLYAAKDLQKGQMVIEYIGEIIRNPISDIREKKYEAEKRGTYMFRLDEKRVIDATMCGGWARYINHSCNPNCYTDIINAQGDLRIIIFAKEEINRGAELSYDYKFEPEKVKIPCKCGSNLCLKWMN